MSFFPSRWPGCGTRKTVEEEDGVGLESSGSEAGLRPSTGSGAAVAAAAQGLEGQGGGALLTDGLGLEGSGGAAVALTFPVDGRHLHLVHRLRLQAPNGELGVGCRAGGRGSGGGRRKRRGRE